MEAEAETRKCEARTREIKVREDLSDIFEVLSHEESTLKCKLAGQDNCKFTLAFKYNSQRGWYNFERHAVSALLECYITHGGVIKIFYSV